jgi:hypothetical protein
MEYCQVDQRPREGLYRCFVRLKEPANHSLLAGKLGARLRENDVCLEIRLREPFRGTYNS